MIYKIKQEDIKECIHFSTKYFLDPKKTRVGRTTGTYRGLGRMINDWLVGKLIEIGVKNILESYLSEKILNLDFEIHQANDDPDIVSVVESGKKRKPNLYVEIKNSSEGDNYIGLTKEQYESTIKNEIVDENPENYYIIYATIRQHSNNNKDLDPYGAYLKRTSPDNIYDEFDEIENLIVEIKNIISAKNLYDFGVDFKKDSYMYDPNLIKEVGNVTEKQLRKLLQGESVDNYSEIELENDILPLIPRVPSVDKPLEFGEVKIYGKVRLFKKENIKSQPVYIYAEEATKLEGSFLGKYELKKNNFYRCSIDTLGRNPRLQRNNIWLSRNNLEYLGLPTISESLEIIQKNI